MVLITHYAQGPKEGVIRRMELFIEQIKRALDEMTDLQRRTGRPCRLEEETTVDRPGPVIGSVPGRPSR